MRNGDARNRQKRTNKNKINTKTWIKLVWNSLHKWLKLGIDIKITGAKKKIFCLPVGCMRNQWKWKSGLRCGDEGENTPKFSKFSTTIRNFIFISDRLISMQMFDTIVAFHLLHTNVCAHTHITEKYSKAECPTKMNFLLYIFHCN